MLTYEPDDTLAHGLDPRAKLVAYAGFAVAAFGWDDPLAVVALGPLALLGLAASGVTVRRALRAYALPVALLGFAVLVRTADLGPPWVDLGEARTASLHAARVLLVLVLGAAYVRSTPVHETQSAIQRHIPGKVGQFLGVGVGFVLRFLPVLRADLGRATDAVRARGGDALPVHERMRLVAVGGVRRALERADRFALALRARCFAWNPTPPPLDFRPRDAVVTLAGLALAATTIL